MSQGKESTAGSKPGTDTEVTERQVVDYLLGRPDFLVKHPRILQNMAAPGRSLGEGVTDFQQAMIDRLRQEIDNARGQSQELIDNSRVNMSVQSRVHECVLALVAANSFEELIQTVTTDMAVILDLDAVTLCIEAVEHSQTQIRTNGLQLLSEGTVRSLVPYGQSCILRSDISGDPDLFGAAAPLVRSDALMRLKVSDATKPALLALGSRNAAKFHPGQATELLTFLTRVLESLVRGWLDLPR